MLPPPNRLLHACPCLLNITECFAELTAEGRTDEASGKRKQGIFSDVSREFLL